MLSATHFLQNILAVFGITTSASTIIAVIIAVMFGKSIIKTILNAIIVVFILVLFYSVLVAKGTIPPIDFYGIANEFLKIIGQFKKAIA